jgi:hypothetical protein
MNRVEPGSPQPTAFDLLAFTRNLVPSGNQEAMRQSTDLPLSDSGSETVCVSPVLRSLILIFFIWSVKAKYFPSGEIALLVTGLSMEFAVI